MPREKVWEVLQDPDLIARMTPFLSSITTDGDHWRWCMTGVKVLGQGFAFEFTEQMTFTEPSRIEFRHDPPEGTSERAGVEGYYSLEEADGAEGGTHLETRLEITVNLPLPKVSGPAVRSAMKGVMATMGDRFAKNMRRQLGVS